MFESHQFKVKVVQDDKVFWFFFEEEKPLPMFNPDIAAILSRKKIQTFDTDPIERPCFGQMEIDFTKNEVSGVLLSLSPNIVFLDNVVEYSKKGLKDFFDCGMFSNFMFWNEDYYETYNVDWDSMEKNEDVILFLENCLSSSFKNVEKIIGDSNNHFNMVPSNWKQDCLYAGFDKSRISLKKYLSSLSDTQKDILNDWFINTKPLIDNSWGNFTSAIAAVQNIFNEEVVEKKIKSTLKSNAPSSFNRF